jgi:hypothetical protein
MIVQSLLSEKMVGNNLTTLELAAAYNKLGCLVELLDYYGRNQKLTEKHRYQEPLKALCYAIERGQFEAVRVLLQFGVKAKEDVQDGRFCRQRPIDLAREQKEKYPHIYGLVESKSKEQQAQQNRHPNFKKPS